MMAGLRGQSHSRAGYCALCKSWKQPIDEYRTCTVCRRVISAAVDDFRPLLEQTLSLLSRFEAAYRRHLDALGIVLEDPPPRRWRDVPHVSEYDTGEPMTFDGAE